MNTEQSHLNLRLNYRSANPEAYRAMLALERFIGGCRLDKSLVELLKTRVSQLNGCAFCVAAHAADLRRLGDYEEQLLLLAVWRDSPVFAGQERAALELAEHLVRIGERGVPEAVYAEARRYFGEAEYVDLVMVVNTINAWNRISISTGMYPGVKLE
ncbi:carboxymuconolactone decarboxylase family protein [Saccharibacillus sp. CPCC 101409]|uniref:carboxymuconolactone decarboxylase family protein n=1 Tax=Saccharibacillus sp. CPCC 101409 TaxID=3058041 RepID=UPI00267205B1|nr:carboxymuconolactone decarboxylase family protein [Saccharibacillus sp. CPCC 101409]MDO3413269.1 carboxymuconolactone decarboxylase family protein [Saccharibacillus sp. CPCC 101409]